MASVRIGPGHMGEEDRVDMRSRRDDSTGPLVVGVVLLIVGVLFLLRNAGLITIDWSIVWPIFVIAIGLIIVIGAVRRTSRGTGDISVSVPVEGARRLELALRLGGGRYRLRGGSMALVEASADEPTIGHVVERRGDLARVRLSTAVDPWGWGWRGGLSWRIGVASGVLTVLDVRAGAGEFDLDLSAIALASASMGIGAADLKVVLPRPRGDVPIRVEGGAASFTFLVPAGVDMRVTTAGLISSDGPSETPGYAAARDRVTVTVSGGAASVRVLPAS
jgi:hypothetical protein